MEAARAFGGLFVEGVGWTVVLPALAGSRLRVSLAILVAFLGSGGVASVLVSRGAVSVPVLAGAQALMGAFLVFLLGCARLLGGRHPAGAAAASLLGLALLASPFLTDPFVEDARGGMRRPVRDVTLVVNPLMGAASPALLGVDWLRRPLLYEQIRLGQFHAYRYPDPQVQGAAFFLLGCLALAAARRRTP